MDVSGEFQKMVIFLKDNGFEAVLENMTVPFMVPVKIDRVSGEDLADDGGDAACACTD